MTITELVERLNKKVSIDFDGGEVVVKQGDIHVLFTFPAKATNFTDFTFVEQIPNDFLGKIKGDYVASQIEEYLQTPIDQRGLSDFNIDSDLEDKLRAEFDDISSRKLLLDHYSCSQNWRSLDATDKRLIGLQRQVMKCYLGILSWRIDRA